MKLKQITIYALKSRKLHFPNFSDDTWIESNFMYASTSYWKRTLWAFREGNIMSAIGRCKKAVSAYTLCNSRIDFRLFLLQFCPDHWATVKMCRVLLPSFKALIVLIWTLSILSCHAQTGCFSRTRAMRAWDKIVLFLRCNVLLCKLRTLKRTEVGFFSSGQFRYISDISNSLIYNANDYFVIFCIYSCLTVHIWAVLEGK